MAENDKVTRGEFDRFVQEQCLPHVKAWGDWLEEEKRIHAKVDRVHLAVFGNGNGKAGMETQMQTLVAVSECNKDNIEKLSLSMFGCEQRKIVGVVTNVDVATKVLSRMDNWLDGLRLLWITVIAIAAGVTVLVTLFKTMGWS